MPRAHNKPGGSGLRNRNFRATSQASSRSSILSMKCPSLKYSVYFSCSSDTKLCLLLKSASLTSNK